MKSDTAIALWAEAIEETVGCDNDGNTYGKMTPFGGAVLALEIGYVSRYSAKHDPEKIRKAACFLRDWADGLESAIEEAK